MELLDNFIVYLFMLTFFYNLSIFINMINYNIIIQVIVVGNIKKGNIQVIFQGLGKLSPR